jgi:DNA-binding XRE family transcriptional regulator
MATTLSPEDIDAVARRVVALLGEKLIAAPAVQPPPEQVQRQTEQKNLTERKNVPKLSYTLAQLAEEVGLSKVSIYRMEALGLIKSVPGIRKKIYSRAEVERFLSGERAHDWLRPLRRKSENPT